ncbi:MAG: prolyl oligopeptidase family serine peptidase [Opitutae bacterium]
MPAPTRLLLLLVLSAAAAAADTQSVEAFKRTITKTVGYEYLLALPAGYATAPAAQWPVILFLHGSGERGTDPWVVAKHGPPKLIRGEAPPLLPAVGTEIPAAPVETAAAREQREAAAAQLTNNFIVVSPQCPDGQWWDDDTILALLDEMAARYRVDPRRVYLTGLSMGGFGTWSVGLKHPERFAAIVPICGGGQPVDARRAAREKKPALLNLGVWAFHGAKDPAVPLAESERMVAALKEVGATDVKFTIYPEAGHDSWTESYGNPELYTWLLQHVRAPLDAAK